MPAGPRCFRCKFVMLSGPQAFEGRLALMASVVWVVVKVCWSFRLSLFLSLLILRESLLDLCSMMEVNCLLNLLAISLALDTYFPLNLIG